MAIDSIYFLFLSHLRTVYMHDERQTKVYHDKCLTDIATSYGAGQALSSTVPITIQK